jgi:YggT family protein
MIHTVAQFLGLLLQVLSLLIIIRAILSWFMPLGRDALTRILLDVTDPVIVPVRNLMNRYIPLQGIDFSPLVVLLLINYVLVPMLATLR